MWPKLLFKCLVYNRLNGLFPKEKGGSQGAALRHSLDFLLRQVVAEGSEEHVVYGVGTNGRRAGQAVTSRPTGPFHVGPLQAPLDSALLALVNLVPEAQGAFHDVASIARAGAAGARCTRGARQSFRRATRVVGIG